MFKKIVVALDGSQCAQQAFDLAIQLAKTDGGELGVCSIVDPIIVGGTTPPSPAMDIVFSDMEREAVKTAENACNRAQKSGVRASGEARRGVAAFEILKYADELGADAIVMGTHGRRGLRHLIVGSVAEVVLREAKVPVIVVRERAPAREPQHSH